jgi:hypothetical protein
MQNKSKISEMLREVMRFCGAHQTHDEGTEELRQILKNIQARPNNDHRTIVVSNAALKCIDEQAWLQIELQELRSKLFFLAHDTENCSDLVQREELMVEMLALTKLLGHIKLASNRLGEGSKELLLQAMTFVMAQNDEQQNSLPPDSTIAPQLKALNEVVASTQEHLAATAESATNNTLHNSSSDSYEDQVNRKALAVVIAFAEKLLNRAISLSEAAINTLPMFGTLSEDNAKAQKQWLIAYAMTAATIANASRNTLQEAVLSYGSAAIKGGFYC